MGGDDGAMRAQMGVNLNYPVGLPDNLEYIVRGDGGWKDGPVSGNWFPDAFMGSMGSLQAFVRGRGEDAADECGGCDRYDADGGGGVSFERAGWGGVAGFGWVTPSPLVLRKFFE